MVLDAHAAGAVTGRAALAVLMTFTLAAGARLTIIRGQAMSIGVKFFFERCATGFASEDSAERFDFCIIARAKESKCHS